MHGVDVQYVHRTHQTKLWISVLGPNWPPFVNLPKGKSFLYPKLMCVCGVSVRNKRPWLHFIAPSARFRDAAATSFMGHYRTCESPSAERIVRVSRKCGSMLILPFGSNYLHNCEHKRASGVYD